MIEIVGSNNESTFATTIFFSTTSSDYFRKSSISSFSCPNVLMTLIPEILSCVLSFKSEKLLGIVKPFDVACSVPTR